MTISAKNKVMGAFAVAGVGLMLSSTAYACTTYKGKLTASGNGVGNKAQTVSGTGSGMRWCALPTPTVKVARTTGSVSLVTAGISKKGTCGASVMANGTYDVGVTPGGSGYMPQGGGLGAEHNCHGVGSDQRVGGGTVTGGVFSPSIMSWNNALLGSAGPSSVCIYKIDGGPDAIAINIDQV